MYSPVDTLTVGRVWLRRGLGLGFKLLQNRVLDNARASSSINITNSTTMQKHDPAFMHKAIHAKGRTGGSRVVCGLSRISFVYAHKGI